MEEIKILVHRFQHSSDRVERNTIFSEIYGRYIKLVYSAINQRAPMLSGEYADDIAQEAMIIVAGALDTFVWETERKLRAWLITITMNKAREAIRKTQKDEGIFVKGKSEEQLVSVADSTEEEPVLKFFETWKEFDSEGFELNYLFHAEGKRDKDIAEILSVSTEAVRKKRTRATKKFVAYLKKECGVSSLNEWIENFSHLKLGE